MKDQEKQPCCEKCKSHSEYREDTRGQIYCTNPDCTCHQSAEKKCTECQFDQPDTYGHSQQCSKYKSATDTAHERGQTIKWALNRMNDNKKDVELDWPTDTAEKSPCADCLSEKPIPHAHSNIPPPTDTSDWRERFDARWNFHGDFQNKPIFSEIKTFIEKELERAREEGKMGMYPIAKEDTQATFEAGQLAERARLREVIEGMKKKCYSCGEIKETRTHLDFPDHILSDVAHNAALQNLLEALSDK